MLTRITDREIPCVYIHVYHIKNWGPGPYNSLCHDNNRKHFSGLSLTQNRREAHMLYLASKVGKIWRWSWWEKGNLIMINKFKYGPTWKIWPSPLSYPFTVSLRGLVGRGWREVVKGQKMVQNDKNSVCPALYLRNHTSYDFGLWYSSVKW